MTEPDPCLDPAIATAGHRCPDDRVGRVVAAMSPDPALPRPVPGAAHVPAGPLRRADCYPAVRPVAGRLGLLGRPAICAAETGWPVFPLRPATTVPAVMGWADAATTNITRIVDWWSAWPWDIGISNGSSGLLVIVLDVAHGEDRPSPWAGARDGFDVLSGLAAAAGQPPPVDTYTVVTPSVINGITAPCLPCLLCLPCLSCRHRAILVSIFVVESRLSAGVLRRAGAATWCRRAALDRWSGPARPPGVSVSRSLGVGR